MGRGLVIAGLAVAGLGLLLLVSPKIPWLGRLPGDLLIRRDHFTFYLPLASSLLVSAVLSVLVWLWGRMR